MRAWIGLLVLLSGCGTAQAPRQVNAYDEARYHLEWAYDACRRNHSGNTGATLEKRFQCMDSAENEHLRPVFPYPDLLNLRQAARHSLLAKVQRGELKPDEAALELAKTQSQIAAEVERRLSNERSVAAQRAGALALLYR